MTEKIQRNGVDWYKFADLAMKFILLLGAIIFSVAFDIPERIFERSHNRQEVVLVEGQVLNSRIAYIQEEAIEIKPVFVNVWNDGDSNFDIVSIELKVFEAQFPMVSEFSQLNSTNTVKFASGDLSGSRRIGVIDNSGEIWQEISDANTVRKPKNCTLRPNQVIQETFHLAVAGSSELFKLEITVRTRSGQSIKWRGFSNPAICRPAPFAPSSGAENNH